MRLRLMVTVTLAVAALAGASWWLTPGRPAHRIDPDDPAQVARGAVLYQAQCARCHGARLEGEANWQIRKPNGELPAPPHDASGHSWHHPDSYLFAVTKHGLAPFVPPDYKSGMPPFVGVLSDDEIRAVLAFIESRWPPDIRARQAAIPQQ